MYYISSLLVLLFCLLGTSVVVEVNADAKDAWSLSKGSREEQIDFWEGEIHKLRNGELAKANHALYSSKIALEDAKRKAGWIFTKSEDKARIKMLDEQYEKNLAEVAVLYRQEQMMLAKIKPLYGIVSRHFVQEQRDTIASAVNQVQQLSYDQAWYSSLFNLRDAETFTDIIVGFLLEWLMGYILMYPFAVLYYALWKAPWSIYAYSSGISDVFVGFMAWAVSVSVMLLPVLALIGGFWYIHRNYGDRVMQSLNTARERERRRR
ncbi:uncharacterized protein TM35_000091240 [Trypanosoma theileri]|uniref:Uncharacterized protein n=1 Tax=Trypanosoma theileri TaxID=67003 RepID=A0A1X0NZF4_9TRYP|nr:uncharacterized protein TM35_000091240 [Trypanosoma theileri]ORC90074.1 hypothetical protein TM35_000091240 [Trypanosoma theileri]